MAHSDWMTSSHTNFSLTKIYFIKYALSAHLVRIIHKSEKIKTYDKKAKEINMHYSDDKMESLLSLHIGY